MKSLASTFYLLALATACGQVFSQPAHDLQRSSAKAGAAMRAPATEPKKASEKKESPADAAANLRARRGSDLRLALLPQNSQLKTQGSRANVADGSTPEPLPEHHLNVKERQEMRELLRQQRLKLQGAKENQ